MNDAPRSCFVCVHNASRSQMAAAVKANRPWPRPRTFPGIASWRIPRPVNTGRQSVGQLKTGVGAVKGEGPRRRDPPKEQPT
jgi:hypothetical protein